MKKSELRKLVSEYTNLQIKLAKGNASYYPTILQKLDAIKRRYFHETGNDLESDLKLDAGDSA
ncbi:MAG: hypothetical protein EPO62_03200 [Candidatus Nitrosotenuis sp.]|nr:MAG: hypothetical protein EPO62_03200 [Candidatus Nitrosotenuis sp.]